MTENERKLRDMIDRFLNEGDYNDEGDYVFVSDTQETGPLAEPDTMVPKIVLDASALLRELQGTGNVIPDVVIQDNRTSPHGDAIAKLEAEAGIAAPLQSREYSITVRRPTWAYGRMTVKAGSADAAIAETKVILSDVNRRYERPSYEAEADAMDPADWISAEADDYDDDVEVDHAEWEQPKPSAGALMKALLAIVAEHDVFTKNGLKNSADVSPIKLANLANTMRRIAENAIANAIPDHA